MPAPPARHPANFGIACQSFASFRIPDRVPALRVDFPYHFACRRHQFSTSVISELRQKFFHLVSNPRLHACPQTWFSLSFCMPSPPVRRSCNFRIACLSCVRRTSFPIPSEICIAAGEETEHVFAQRGVGGPSGYRWAVGICNAAPAPADAPLPPPSSGPVVRHRGGVSRPSQVPWLPCGGAEVRGETGPICLNSPATRGHHRVPLPGAYRHPPTPKLTTLPSTRSTGVLPPPRSPLCCCLRLPASVCRASGAWRSLPLSFASRDYYFW